MRTTLVLVTVAFGLVAACGGDSATTGIPIPDGGNNPDGNNGLDGSNNKPDGSNPDGGNNLDGSNNLDGNNAGDGNNSLISTLACGNQTCALPSETCCIDIAPNPNVFKCTGGDAGGACGAGLVELQCKSAADCAGSNVCCLDATVDPAKATCQASCGGVDHVMLCDPNGSAQANRCGDAGACGNQNIDTWGLTPQFGTCGDPMGPF